MRKFLLTNVLAAILGTLMAATNPMTANAVEITEWPVPWEDTRPRDPFADNEKHVWFVGQKDDYVGFLNLETGEMGRIDLPAGTGPHNLIVDGNANIWIAGNRQAYIGRLNADSGELKQIAMPDPAARDPHTLVFDKAGNIWFTMQGSNMAGRLEMASEKVDVMRMPTRGARPYGITIAPDGRPWIALLGTNKLASIDPATLAVSEVELPRSSTRPRRLEATSDGAIWYVDYRDGYLGRLDPATGAIEEWRMPSGDGSGPYGMAVDAKDRLWIVETGPNPNRFVGFDTNKREFIYGADIPSGGGSVRHMMYHAPSNSVWFGTDANTIGRAKLD